LSYHATPQPFISDGMSKAEEDYSAVGKQFDALSGMTITV